MANNKNKKKKTAPAGKIFRAKNQKQPVKLAETNGDRRSYTIRDYRLEKPHFTARQVRVGGDVQYEVESGDLATPAPPIRDSKYLRREQCIEI